MAEPEWKKLGYPDEKTFRERAERWAAQSAGITFKKKSDKDKEKK